MAATPGTLPGPRPEGLETRASSAAANPFPIPLTSPHIVVMNADLAELEHTGYLLSGRGYGITLSSTLLDESTCAFLKPDLVIVDFESVVPAMARRIAERTMIDMVHRERIPIIICRSGLQRGPGSGRPGVASLTRPFHPAHLRSAVEALLFWRSQQQRLLAMRGVNATDVVSLVGETG